MAMARQGFEATVRRDGTAAILDLRGEIDAGAEATLNAAYGQAAVEGVAEVLLDFGDVSYINSTGIALIVGLVARARGDQVRLLARRLSEHYREIFEITRLSDYVTVLPDETEVDGRADPAGGD
jgi:anti-anti-sigma factor